MVRAIVNSPTFNGKKKDLYKHFASLNYPIPPDGFKSLEDLATWHFTLREAHIDTNEKLQEIYKFYNLSEDNLFVRSALMRVIYFNSDAEKLLVTQPPLQIVNVDKDPDGLLFTVRVTDKTRKEDLDILWDRIDLMLYRVGELPRSRNKDWQEFESDLAIYKLSELAKKRISERDDYDSKKRKELPEMMRSICAEVASDAYLSSEDSTIYKAINRFKSFVKRTGLKNII